jgi:BirA family biotin operon repressor/biotin-[acetyl-CoA-carboxylase] ligase
MTTEPDAGGAGSDLAPPRVATLLRGSFGRPYLYARTCPSTQDLLRGTTLPEGAVAVAEHQTAGRGRSGRRWEDEEGASLLLSVLLRPPAERVLPELSLVAGLAAAEAVESATGMPARVKWPNDVVLAGRKVAGILLEHGGDSVVCGIGVNVRRTPAPLQEPVPFPPGSLHEATGAAHDRGRLLAGLLERLETRYAGWGAEGLGAISAELAGRNALRGLRARNLGAAGTVGEIAPDGRLELLLDEGGLRLVESGELELAR